MADEPDNVIVLRPKPPMEAQADDSEKPVTRQCTAKSQQSGKRCRRHAIKGGTVCATHGGRAPQVKASARLRLANLVDPAITTLSREMVTAQASSDRQRAANSILDRAGISRAASPEVEMAKTLLLERLIALREAQVQSAQR